MRGIIDCQDRWGMSDLVSSLTASEMDRFCDLLRIMTHCQMPATCLESCNDMRDLLLDAQERINASHY